MNCLAYSLRFWKDNPEYRLFYHIGHVIAVDGFKVHVEGAPVQFTPIEEYGYCYFKGAFRKLLDSYEWKLLKRYFEQIN